MDFIATSLCTKHMFATNIIVHHMVSNRRDFEI
nr:MAG TPA: hypothetical protein [Caudoviricetes sp.]